MVTVKVNVRKELARFKRFGAEGRADLKEFMQRHGRALISSSGKSSGIIQLTPPHSKGKRGNEAKKQGEAAVSSDINKVYGSPGKLFALIKQSNPGAANGFWTAARAKDWARANEIAMRTVGKQMGDFDDGAAHAQRRNNRGRINGKNPSVFIAQFSGGDLHRAGPKVRRYIAKRQKNVGLLAAALVVSAELRLAKLAGVPAWVRRHASKAAGTAATTILENASGIVVTANVNSPRVTKGYQRQMNYAAEYRLTAMKSDLPRTAKRLEDRLQKGL